MFSKTFSLSRKFSLTIATRFLSSTPANSSLNTLIIGAPGSGKGTISNWIVRDFKLEHVSSGDLLRAEMNAQSAIGKEAKAYIDKGDLVPDKVIVQLISNQLKAIEAKGENWLLDGFPRTLPQAESLQRVAPIDVVLFLDIPFQTIVRFSIFKLT